MICWAQAKRQRPRDRKPSGAASADAWKLNIVARTCFGESVPAVLNQQAALIAPAAGETFEAKADAPAKLSDHPRDLFLDAAASPHSTDQPRPSHCWIVCSRATWSRSGAVLLRVLPPAQGEHRVLSNALMSSAPCPERSPTGLSAGVTYGMMNEHARAESEFAGGLPST